MIYEDVDLSFYTQLFGYECVLIRNAISSIASMDEARERRRVFHSPQTLSCSPKNMPTGIILRFLPQRLLYEVAAPIYSRGLDRDGPFLKKSGQFSNAAPLFRKRQVIPKKTVVSNAQLRARIDSSEFACKWIMNADYGQV
jgi:hypothetical protein